MKPIFKVILLAIAYLATFFLGAFTGIIHPACYAYVGALLPFITAFIYKADGPLCHADKSPSTQALIAAFDVPFSVLPGFQLIAG